MWLIDLLTGLITGLLQNVLKNNCRGEGRGFKEEVKEDDIYLKFGQKYGKTDRQTLLFTGKLHF